MRTLRFIIQIGLGILLTLAVQWWDRRRLAPARRERAWNAASWGAALYAFGPLSMIGWAWVTRQEAALWWRRNPAWAVVRSALLLLAGAGVALAILLVMGEVDRGIGRLTGEPPEAEEIEAPAPPRKR